MALTINLPGGRAIMLDENTGNIVGETSTASDGSGGTVNRDDWWRDTTTPAPPPDGGGDEFDPSTDRVTEVVNLPGGKQVTYNKNGQLRTTFVPDGGGGVSSSTAYSQQQQNARSQAELDEQRRQYNETFGFDKAKFNMTFAENQRQFNEGQDLERGKTLLSLGSRPDTLTRYLYAIRGQQTPQALGGQTATLPGFNNIFATPGRGTVSPNSPTPPPTWQVPGPVSTAQPTAPQPTPQQKVLSAIRATPKQGDLAQYVAPGGTNITTTDPRLSSTPQAPTPAKVLPTLGAQDALIAQGRTPRFYSDGVAIFKDGGVVPEPVMGVGMMTGMRYMFGEAGPETVVPEGKSVSDVQHLAGQMMGGGKGYAIGGTIGYDPELYNPSGLADIVSRGYNSTPDVPLLPAVGQATGGTSFIPSAQRFSSLLPSERSAYAGALGDEFGLQSDDVFSLAQKLAPKARGLQTPRYS